MKYTFFKSNSGPRTAGEKKYLYLVPLAVNKEDYAIICPGDLDKNLLNPVYYDNMEIKQYAGCFPGAARDARDALLQKVSRAMSQHSSSITMLRVLGLLLVTLGIIDFFLPDPMVLLDEVLILTGGSVMLTNWLRSRRSLVALQAKIGKIKEKIEKLPVSDDPICTAIYKSIQARDESFIKNLEQKTAADPFDLEARWFVRFLNIEEMVKADRGVLLDLQNIVTGVSSIIPVAKLQQVDAGIQASMKRGRRIHRLVKKMKNLKTRVTEHSGFSDDAITVYTALVRAVEDLLEEDWV